MGRGAAAVGGAGGHSHLAEVTTCSLADWRHAETGRGGAGVEIRLSGRFLLLVTAVAPRLAKRSTRPGAAGLRRAVAQPAPAAAARAQALSMSSLGTKTRPPRWPAVEPRPTGADAAALEIPQIGSG